MKNLVLSVLCFLPCFCWGQLFPSARLHGQEKEIDDNLGIFASLGLNSTYGSINSGEGYARSAKGALSPVVTIGGFYQKGINDRLSVRLSAAIGQASYAYRYAQQFDSIKADGMPTTTKRFNRYTRVTNPSLFVAPQIDLGYILPPYKEMYVFELRGGVGMHAYAGRNRSEKPNRFMSGRVVTGKNGFLDYNTTEKSFYGDPAVFGTFIATIYAGVRWQRTTSDWLNHSAIGIQITAPFNTSNTGFSEIEYRGEPGNYMLGSERVDMTLLTFGIRYTYSFL